MSNKIKNYSEIGRIAYRMRFFGKIIVTTNGSFDVLHAAHVRLLERARQEGDGLIVLLNSNDSVRRAKGDKRPIFNQKERAYMLSGLSCVDYVTIFDEDKPLSILKTIQPHIYVKGGSYVPEWVREEQNLVESWGGRLKCFDLEKGYSSTNIIDKIMERYNGKED